MSKQREAPKLDWKGYLVCLRHNRNLSQVALSRLVEVSDGAVGTWEYETCRPRFEVANKLIALDPELAEKYRVSKEEIAEQEEKKKKAAEEKKKRVESEKAICCSGVEKMGEELSKLSKSLKAIANQGKDADIWNSEIRTITSDIYRLENRIEKLERGLRAIMGLE